jgi:hypothetical protein
MKPVAVSTIRVFPFIDVFLCNIKIVLGLRH